MRSTDDRSDVDRDELIQDDAARVGRHESGDADTSPAEVPAEARVNTVEETDAEVQHDVQDEAPAAVGVARAIPAQNRAPAVDRLLDSAVSGRFQERWREVQASFVDDPAAAVAAAAALLDEVGTELTNAIRRQRDTLGAGDAAGQGDETERLRTSLQAYRRLVVHLIEA